MFRTIQVKEIRPNPFQTRKTMDREAIRSLADEIKHSGLWAGALRGREINGHVEICFGHRRLEAIRLLGWKEVDVDVAKLTDEEMAFYSLAENLQRDGLNDADKGEGLKRYLDLHVKNGLKEAAVKSNMVVLFGLGIERINMLLRVADMEEEVKTNIRAKKIAGSTADAARRIGGRERGPAAIKAAMRHQLSQTVVYAINEKIASMPEDSEEEKKIKDRVRQCFADGKITTPEQAITKMRQFKAAQQQKDWRDKAPDLKDVIRSWVVRARQWSKQLDEVLPYMNYVDQEPELAKRWREAVKELIAKLQRFI
jgi:ParB family chromosome partitioning protein